MDKAEFSKQFEKIYTYTHQTLLESNFRFPQGVANGRASFNKAIDRIWKLYGDSVGVVWIVDYCLAQLYYYKDSVGQGRKFSLSWSFGAKAVDRYVSEKQGSKYYQNKWLRVKGVVRRELVKKFTPQAHPLKKYVHLQHEEGAKQRRLNTEVGYHMCGMLTTLYAPLSDACGACLFAEKCKERLKNKNYELYRLREI